MDKTIRRVTDFKEQRLETYRYWRSRPISERIEAITEIARDVYRGRGIDGDTRPSDKTIVRRERISRIVP